MERQLISTESQTIEEAQRSGRHVWEKDIPDFILDNLLHEEIIGVDTETRGLNPRRDRLCLVQLATRNGSTHICKPEYGAATNLSLLFESSVIKVCHFARFDLAFLEYWLQGEFRFKPFHCTKVMSKLLRTYGQSHGLATLVNEFLGMEMSKTEQMSDWGKKEFSNAQIDYAIKDAFVLPKIYDKLYERLDQENLLDLAFEAFEMIPLLVKLDLMEYQPLEVFAL